MLSHALPIPRWIRAVLSALLLYTQAAPVVAQAFTLPSESTSSLLGTPSALSVLPAWFASSAPESGSPNTQTLPIWFTAAPSPLSSSEWAVSSAREIPGASLLGTQTIYANQITVTLTPQQINLCDPLTVTVVAANNSVTTTGVVITVTLPGGFTNNTATFNVGEVAPNAVITREATFTATCGAVSGQVVVTLTQDAYPPIVKIAEYVVNPGAITVRKEPAVIPAAVGDVVTWTVLVENTGYGTVYNVRVTDTLGPGLQFVGGTTATTYLSIPVGQTVSFTVSAQVASCSGLENSVIATWGCNGETCLTPQTAKAAIDLLLRFPELKYSLPNFNVDYCAGGTVFTIPITNVGDGAAYSVTLLVDLSPFTVSVAPPATYVAGAFQIPQIPPGQTFNLVFTLTTPSNVCGLPANGGFSFDLNYRDACTLLYTEIPQSAGWQLVNTPGSLSVSKLMPSEVYRGALITAPITVNASGISGSIRVTDRVPAGFTVVSTGGGVSFTLGGFTYITWVITGSTVLTPVFVVVTETSGCVACGLALTNWVTATAGDCRNCQQEAQAQATTYVQCDEGVQSLKLVSDPAPVCTNAALTYTNRYTFPLNFSAPPTWTGLIFTESLTNQTYVAGSAQVFVSNGNISCSATFSEAVVGGQLVITNINPPCNPSIAGATLIISYTTTPTETSSCSDVTWYDWSYLNLGTTGNSTCGGSDVVVEGVFVQTRAPRMSLSLSGLPQNVAACGTYTVTLTAQRTNDIPAYDALIEVPTNTYAVLEVLGFGGATPVFTETGSFGYRWFYSDAFASALTATVQLRVQLRCGATPAPFAATLHYESVCTNDDTYFERCSAGGTLSTPRRLSPLPLVTKFPERIYATSDFVTWTLVAKNTGAGPAYNVVLTDALGSGLRFVTATITSSLGAVTSINVITSTNLVTWEVPVIQPKETLTIRYTAEIVSCTDLTNRFSGAQGCLGQTCLGGGPVSSVVELPPTVLLNTNQTFSPIETCFTRTVTVTVRNAGLLSVYSATVTQTLPNGLFYVPGSTQISTDTLNWQPGPDPTISGQTLIWEPTAAAPLGDWLKRLYPKDTVYLRFDVRASCAFAGGQLRIRTGYRDVCGLPFETATSSYVLGVKQAELSITKVGQNLSRTSPSDTYLYAEPGEVVVFTITVANAANAAPAQLVVISDALPANLVFQDATPGYAGATPGTLGGTITWSLSTLNPGSTAVFTVSTVVSQPQGCQITDTFNVASVSWGCPDGCRLTLPAQQVRVRTRPVYDAPDIAAEIAPNALNVCGGVITLTLRNDGPPAYNVVLTTAPPSGYVYSDTLSASVTPSNVTPVGDGAVYTWQVLPSGVTTITLRVRNANTNGACAVPSGAFTATLLYDDDVPDCPASGPYSATASVNLNVRTPALTVSKTPAFRIAAVGQAVTWTIRVTNTGSGTAFNVRITDVVGSSFVNVTATNGALVAGNTITWTLSALAPNTAFSAIVTGVITTTGENRNVVTATSSCGTGCFTASGVATAFVSLGDLFAKGPAVQTGTVGSLVVFTFTGATNDADNIFTQVLLTDALPTGLGFVSATLSYTVDLDGNQGGPTTVVNLAPTITPGLYLSGNVVWNLGVITGAARFTGTVIAVIQNVTQTNEGNILTNTLRITFLDDGQLGVLTATARVNTIEPLLHLGKTYLTPYGCDGTLLADNFNRPAATPPTGWQPIAATWANENGLLVRTGGSQVNALIVRSNFTATEFSYSALVSMTDGSASIGLVFRYTASNQYYRLRLRLNDSGTGVQLQKVTSTSIPNLATVNTFTPTLRQWYHLEVQVEEVANGLRIRAFVDGKLVISVTDTTPLPAGTVGIYSNNCVLRACAFDDVLVTRLNRAGCFVGANDLVTYTLLISNQGRLPAYDLVITDVLPVGVSLVTYTVSTNDPSGPTVLAGPTSGATGVLTWLVSHLTPTVPFTTLQHTGLTITVIAQVAPWITANVTLSNHAFLQYDAWREESQPISSVVRIYSGGSHAAAVQTADGGISKQVQFAPPPTVTLGSLVTYTLLIPSQPISAVLYNVLVTDVLDSRLQVVNVTAQNGFWSWGWSGQQVTASFQFITANAQGLVTITARLAHEYPNAANDANAGDVITNVARMSHSTAGVTTSNVVSVVVGEPSVSVAKEVTSSAGVTTGLDGTALLTYTLRLRNTGSSPAYSVYVTDVVPQGISVTALYGGDARSAPVVGSGTLTWLVGVISNAAPANEIVLSYTARISQAALGALLTNAVEIKYHSLTDTLPGVRAYTATATATMRTAEPRISKQTDPETLRVGDVVTYTIVFTIPAGTVWGGAVLRDALLPGIWYITDSETLTYTPGTVSVTTTQRVSNTTEVPGHQVIYWTFAPITSEQDAPTVVTLTFRAQAVGLQIDNGASVWPTQTEALFTGDYVELQYPFPNVVAASVSNRVIQPQLEVEKRSEPAPGTEVGAGALITYVLVITNQGLGPAYDVVVSDVLPVGMTLLTYTLSVNAPATTTLLLAPSVGASGVLSWVLSELWGKAWNANQPGVVVITAVAQVSTSIGARQVLTNRVTLPYYDSQPDTGAGPYTPRQREYVDGSDEVTHTTGLPQLVVRKTATTTVEAGDRLTYTIVVTNAGAVSATGVVVSDVVPANTSFVSCEPAPCVESSGVVSWALGVLDIAQPRVLTLVVQVASPLVSGTTILNRVVVSATEGVTASDEVTTVVGSAPVLQVEKRSEDVNGAPLRPGDVLSYTIVLENVGNAVANNVAVSDVLPTHTTYVAGSIQGGDQRSDSSLPVLTWTVNALTPGVRVTLTYAVRVEVPLTNGLTLNNQVEVRSSELTTPVRLIVTDVVASALQVALAKSVVSAVVEAGELLTYTLRYTVSGDAPALGVVISDATPANTTYAAADPAPTLSPGVGNSGAVVWVLGDVMPPASGVTQVSGVLTLVVRVESPLVSGTVITNTALITEQGGLSNTAQVTSEVTSQYALAVSKEAEPRIAVAGEQLTYTLRYTVSGNAPTSGVVVSDRLPTSVTFQTCAPACTVSGGVVSWTLGALNPPASGVLTVIVVVNGDVLSGTLLSNEVTISDERGVTDTARVDTPVEARAELVLRKQATPTLVIAGELLTYVVLVTNTGPSVAQEVIVTDDLPAEVTLVGAEPPASVSGQTLSWTLGALAVGETRVLTVTVRVSASVAAGSVLTNTASVTTSTGGDTPSDNTDRVSTPVANRAELALTKHSAVSITVPGASVTFTLLITNFGPSVARDVVVTDTLPATLNYVSASPSPAVQSGQLVVWQLGDLDVGQHVILTLVVTLSTSAAYNQPITNTAIVTTSTPGDEPANNIAEQPMVPVQPTVAIQKQLISHDTDPIAPNFVTFSIRLTNTGLSVITVLHVEDVFDGNVLTYTTATPEPDVATPGQLTWSNLLGAAPHGYSTTLPPGQSVVITVTFRVISDITTTTNTARVGSGTHDEFNNPTPTPSDSATVSNVPTAVTLRAFYVEAVNGRRVTLAWETETEQDNFAFRLYRAPSNDFARAEYIGSVPAAMSGASGARYTFDDLVPDDGIWWYWLADVDTAGRETVHTPPVRAVVGLVPYRVWLPLVMRAE